MGDVAGLGCFTLAFMVFRFYALLYRMVQTVFVAEEVYYGGLHVGAFF